VCVCISTGSAEELAMSSGGGPLPLCLSIITSSPTALDLSAHVDTLQLAGNLLFGAAVSCLICPDDATSPNDLHWPSLSDRLLVPMAEDLLTHVIRSVMLLCLLLYFLSKHFKQFSTSHLNLSNQISYLRCQYIYIYRLIDYS